MSEPKELNETERAEIICGIIIENGKHDLVETGRMIAEVLNAIIGTEF